MENVKSLQDTFAPHHVCAGCGPANSQGLQIKSYVRDDGKVVTEWNPKGHHTAFPGILSGGIIGMLFDCHSNWTAAWNLMQQPGSEQPPTTVTAEFHVKLLKPTPLNMVTLIADVVEISNRKAVVEAEMHSIDGDITATCRGVFIAVKPDHPLHGKW